MKGWFKKAVKSERNIALNDSKLLINKIKNELKSI